MKQLPFVSALIGFAATAVPLAAQTAEQQEPTCDACFSNTTSASVSGATDMKGVGKGLGGVSSWDLASSIGYSITAIPDLELDLGMNYQGSFFHPDHEAAAPMVKRLQSISNDVSAKWMLNEEWIVLGGAGVALNNSGTHFNSDGLNATSFAGVIHPIGDKTTLMVGAAFSSLAKNGHKFMPGFGIQYQYSQEWSISLGFPNTAITWQPIEQFRLSLVAEGNYETYYVKRSDLTLDHNGAKLVGNSRMEYEDTRLGLSASYDMNTHLTLSATAGYLFGRRFDFFEDDYELKSDGGAPYGTISVTAKF